MSKGKFEAKIEVVRAKHGVEASDNVLVVVPNPRGNEDMDFLIITDGELAIDPYDFALELADIMRPYLK